MAATKDRMSLESLSQQIKSIAENPSSSGPTIDNFIPLEGPMKLFITKQEGGSAKQYQSNNIYQNPYLKISYDASSSTLSFGLKEGKNGEEITYTFPITSLKVDYRLVNNGEVYYPNSLVISRTDSLERGKYDVTKITLAPLDQEGGPSR